jgi:hypothetical protein
LLQFAEILLNHHKEKWINNGGPLLEIIPLSKIKVDDVITAALYDLIMPFVNEETKAECLANALATAIQNDKPFEENYLRHTLGADLNYATRKPVNHYKLGKTFEVRLKLARNGADLFVEENEDKELIVARVDIPTKTAMAASVRKKMPNVQETSEIFYELSAAYTDPRYSSWKHIKSTYSEYCRRAPIKVMDKETGKIYNGTPEIEDLVYGLNSFTNEMSLKFNHIAGDPAFKRKFALFLCVEEPNAKKIIFPKGLRVMFKPKEKPSEINLEPATLIQQNWPEKNENQGDAEDDIGELRPRRETRAAAKRKRNEGDEEAEANKDQGTKRRKTIK